MPIAKLPPVAPVRTVNVTESPYCPTTWIGSCTWPVRTWSAAVKPVGSVSCTQLRERSVPFFMYLAGEPWVGLLSRTVSSNELSVPTFGLLMLQLRMPKRTTSIVKVSCSCPFSEVLTVAVPPFGL